MPRCPKTGTVTRARFTSLKLGELSSVDRPAQAGALATIMKRDDGTPPPAPVRKTGASLLAMSVAKYIDSDAGAHTFDEVLQANVFDEKIWPMTSALSQSIRSIMADKNLKPADKETKVTDSVDEFLTAVREISPSAEKRLAELISKKDDTMKTVAELIAENPALKAHIEGIEGERNTAKTALETEKAAHVETAKALTAASDEVIKVDGQDVRKSAVGDASFAVFKSLDNRATMATLEKRAGDEFGALVGTATEKALVLKHAATMDEATRKAFDAILTSAQAMAAKGFDRLGGAGGLDPTSDVAKAQGDFKGKVTEIAKRDGVSEFKAMQKARTEFPDEFAAAYPDQAAAA
jgi:hypothetical protein